MTLTKVVLASDVMQYLYAGYNDIPIQTRIGLCTYSCTKNDQKKPTYGNLLTALHCV